MYSMDYYGNTEKYIIEKGKFFIIFINWKKCTFQKMWEYENIMIKHHII